MTLYKQVGPDRIPLTAEEEADCRAAWATSAANDAKVAILEANRKAVLAALMDDRAAAMGLEI